MNASALKALEFDRIVSVVTGLAVTSLGRDRLVDLHPLTTTAEVLAAQRATTEGTRFLADYPGFPLRAPADLGEIIDALGVEGRGLEPMRLLGLSGYLESIEQSRQAITKVGAAFPLLTIASSASRMAPMRRVRRHFCSSSNARFDRRTRTSAGPLASRSTTMSFNGTPIAFSAMICFSDARSLAE